MSDDGLWIEFDTPEALKEEVPPSTIPPGRYFCKIVSCERKRSSRGHYYLQWEFQLAGAYSNAYHEEFRLWHVTPMTEGITEALADLIEACVGMRPWGTMKIYPSQYVSKEVAVIVGTKEYRGQLRNSVERVEAT